MESFCDTVLLLEDDADARHVIERVMTHQGLRVVAASDVEDARALAEKEHPQVVVCSVSSASCAEAAFIHTLTSPPDHPPVVCTIPSAADLDVLRPVLEACGVCRVIAKPFNVQAFSTEIIDVLASMAARGNVSVRLQPIVDQAAHLHATGEATMPGRGSLAPSVPTGDPLIGTMISSWKVVRRLGAGGMGTVYLGEHPVIGSRVAIKVLHESACMDSDSVRRFFAEARVTNVIGHPGIVKVFDLGTLPSGRHFMVMEHLDGQTLHHWGRGRALEPAQAVPVLVQVCHALHAAHEAGVIHRDVKPDNIFVQLHPDGTLHVKLMDFGIAKLRESHASWATQRGSVLGTPRYMSPEQCSGRPVDVRSDLYAVGVIAYELLTGAPLYPYVDVPLLMQAHQRELPVAPHVLRDDVSRMLGEAVMGALEKDPAHRPADMLAFARMLESALAPRQPTLVLDRTPEAAMLPVEPRPVDAEDEALWEGIASAVTPPMLPVPAPRARRGMNVAWVALLLLLAGDGAVRVRHTAVAENMTLPVETVPTAESCSAPEPVASVDTKAKKKPVSTVKAAPSTGMLSLQSHPWARLVIDGADTGKFTPIASLPLSAGTHRVTLINDKVGKQVTFAVNIPRGGHVRESRELE